MGCLAESVVSVGVALPALDIEARVEPSVGGGLRSRDAADVADLPQPQTRRHRPDAWPAAQQAHQLLARDLPDDRLPAAPFRAGAGLPVKLTALPSRDFTTGKPPSGSESL